MRIQRRREHVVVTERLLRAGMFYHGRPGEDSSEPPRVDVPRIQGHRCMGEAGSSHAGMCTVYIHPHPFMRASPGRRGLHKDQFIVTSVAAVHARLSSLPICSLGASLGNAELLSFSTAPKAYYRRARSRAGIAPGRRQNTASSVAAALRTAASPRPATPKQSSRSQPSPGD